MCVYMFMFVCEDVHACVFVEAREVHIRCFLPSLSIVVLVTKSFCESGVGQFG